MDDPQMIFRAETEVSHLPENRCRVEWAQFLRVAGTWYQSLLADGSALEGIAKHAYLAVVAQNEAEPAHV